MEKRVRKSKRTLWIIIAAVVLALFIAGRIISKQHKAKTVAELPIAVRVMNPKVGPVYDRISVSGTVSAKEEANAYSKVPGKLLRYVKAEGDWVRKDQVVAWVERDEVGLTYEPAPVKAPIAGQVAQRFLEIGTAVSAGMGGPGTPVALIVNPGQLEVKVNVIEKDAARVQPGQEALVRVDAYPTEVFRGRIDRVSPVVDRMTRTTLVVVRLESPEGKLKSGMFADVELIVGQKPSSLLLPREAVLKQNQQYYVYVVEKDRAIRREVKPGWPQDAETEILNGIAPQDRVVVEGQTRLTADSRVQVLEGE
ncbi:MAG: efflux RND transporter periplasmic adaptor subunit [candidate division FCPU426 bacterium]